MLLVRAGPSLASPVTYYVNSIVIRRLLRRGSCNFGSVGRSVTAYNQ